MSSPEVFDSPASAVSSPQVSVIIPTYGHRDFVERTLSSVFAQTFTDFEIIVINDGSPDDTDIVLGPYVAKGTIRYVAQTNAGVAAARNKGISMARGEYIALLDDDDLWPEDKLFRQVRALQENPTLVMVYGAIACIDSHDLPMTPLDSMGNPLSLPCASAEKPGPSGNVFEAFVQDNAITSPGQCLIRRSALLGQGETPFDPNIWGADDWDLWLRLAEQGTILYQPEVALCYRFHGGNASHNIIRMRQNCLALLQKHRERQRGNPERYKLLTDKYNEWVAQTYEHFFHLAWLDYNAGNCRQGLIKLQFVARVNWRACLNRRFYGLLLRLVQGIRHQNK